MLHSFNVTMMIVIFTDSQQESNRNRISTFSLIQEQESNFLE